MRMHIEVNKGDEYVEERKQQKRVDNAYDGCMRIGSRWIFRRTVGKYFPILKYGYSLGVSAHEWNLHILRLTFGFDFNINMFSILGIAIAIYIYRKL